MVTAVALGPPPPSRVASFGGRKVASLGGHKVAPSRGRRHAAASGTPWQYFDLGHGYCTYSFFEQCPHRMACARCDFYVPKESTRAELLEAQHNLQRMIASVPLAEAERAAVDDGAAAVDRLLERL